MRDLQPSDEVFIVDASSFIYRAFFSAEGQDIAYRFNSRNEPIGALKLFTERLFKMRRWGVHHRDPTHMAMVFDAPGRRSFRHDIFPAYKANRPETPDDLKRQMPLMREAATALGIVPVEEPWFEADDLIATYAHTVADQGAAVLIISADKDLMQLIRPGVMMFDPETGVPNFPGHRPERYIGRDEVIEKFGVSPDKVVEVQALAGDTGDGVPGVYKVGAKTAAKLIIEHGTMEAVLAAAPAMKASKLRDNLIRDTENARISHRLVKLDCAVEYTVGVEAMLLEEIDHERILVFARHHGLTNVIQAVEKDLSFQRRG